MRFFIESHCINTKNNNTEATTASNKATIAEIIELFSTQKHPEPICIVDDQKKVVGMVDPFSFAEFIYMYTTPKDSYKERCSNSYATKTIPTLFITETLVATADNSMTEIYSFMNSTKSSTIPIVDSEEKFQGVITINDVIAYMGGHVQ